MALCLRDEEVAGHVAPVDRFDQQLKAMLAHGLGRVPQVGQVGGAVQVDVGADGQQARHHVHARGAQRQRILDGARHAGTEFFFAARQRRNAPLTGRPVARRQVEQHILQTVLAQPAGHFLRRVVIREQEFDAFKTRLRGGGKALRERDFVEHHGQVGGKTGHAVSPWESYMSSLNVCFRSAICAASSGRVGTSRSSRNSLAVSSSSSAAYTAASRLVPDTTGP
ncbi:hypothetical protein D3C87_925760 [compost metagenome]